MHIPQIGDGIPQSPDCEHWLIRILHDRRCHKVNLIQPDDCRKRKTDRRDVAALSELLWGNRDRLLQGNPVRGLRQVESASSTDQENRCLTMLRRNRDKRGLT